MESADVVCKYCQSEHVRKYGTYKETQYYYCNDCSGATHLRSRFL